jgi:hypothetical protein
VYHSTSGSERSKRLYRNQLHGVSLITTRLFFANMELL